VLVDNQLQKAKRLYEANPDDLEHQLNYCRLFSRAGKPNIVKEQCLIPWCTTKVRKHTLCLSHRKPHFYEALSIPPHIELPDNWRYHVEVNYTSDYNCEAHGCDREGICRCGRIEYPTVESIDSVGLTRAILTNSGQFSVITDYAVERSLRHLINVDYFDIAVVGGYYGEEIGDITLGNQDDLLTTLKNLLAMTPNDQIRESLKLEYRMLLPELVNSNFTVQKIETSKITYQKERYNAVDKDQELLHKYIGRANHSYYADRPQVLVLQEEDGYRLIDGYHRLKAWIKAGTIRRPQKLKKLNSDTIPAVIGISTV